MSKIVKSFQYGSDTFRLETGEIARQADAAIVASCGDTVVMVTVVSKISREPKDFIPLTVDVEERSYAAGRIPGGFFRREGRPSEKAILTCRLIDRPLRPLFPEGFGNDVQLIATVVSVDPDIDIDIVSLVGASAAMAISGIPFNGPVGAARVGYIDGDYILNPRVSQLREQSALDLIVAGTEKAVLMVESEADVLSEEKMLGAVMYGHRQMQKAIDVIRELAVEVSNPAKEWFPSSCEQEFYPRVAEVAHDSLEDAFNTSDKRERGEKNSASARADPPPVGG